MPNRRWIAVKSSQWETVPLGMVRDADDLRAPNANGRILDQMDLSAGES